MGLRQPQTYFAFRQFTIHQERCAMKVSTDACIQGAWLPLDNGIRRVLDVGTGTGLLSLMLAQRGAQLIIDAIEIEPAAVVQATQNVQASPFAPQIKVIEADARIFEPSFLYDLIVCNPPFFSQDLTGPDAARNAVRHDALLSAADIISLAGRALQPTGRLCIMWPPRRMEAWEALMRNAGFHNHAMLTVRNKEGARASSIISLWGRYTAAFCRDETLIIRVPDGSYTADFIHLLQDFYLRLS